MIRAGFIQNDLDLKLLVLYIMDRTAFPITFLQLLDLALCDAGVDYFSLRQVVDHLVERENLSEVDERYAITDKGRRNCLICESSLPYSVRHHCDENLVHVNAALMREAHVQGRVLPNKDGTVTVNLILSDTQGLMMDLKILAPDITTGDALITHFKSTPETTYHKIMELLSPTDIKDSH